MRALLSGIDWAKHRFAPPQRASCAKRALQGPGVRAKERKKHPHPALRATPLRALRLALHSQPATQAGSVAAEIPARPADAGEGCLTLGSSISKRLAVRTITIRKHYT